MARHSIKLFQFLLGLYQMLGIYPPQGNEKFRFNKINLLVLFCYAQLCIPMVAFFILKAKSMQEYGATFFAFLTLLVTTIDFLILMWKMPNILNSIRDFEEFIEKSKYQIIFYISKFLIPKS